MIQDNVAAQRPNYAASLRIQCSKMQFVTKGFCFSKPMTVSPRRRCGEFRLKPVIKPEQCVVSLHNKRSYKIKKKPDVTVRATEMKKGTDLVYRTEKRH